VAVERRVQFPILASLDEAEREAVLSEARRRRFARDEVIMHAGDPADALHLIARGRVIVRRSGTAGGNSILAVLNAGEFFGELALIAGEPHSGRTATVQAIEVTETICIRAERFEDLRRRRPEVDRFLVESLARRVVLMDDLLVEAMQIPAETRVLRRLLAVAQQFRPADPTMPLVVPLNQADLASMAGTSRATASRIVRTAAQAGALHLGRGRIEILDERWLRRMTS
jgi:CRP-like cAMP-binding protein